MPEGISSLNVGLGTNTIDTIRLTFRGRVIFLVRKWRQLSLNHLNCSHYVLEKLQGFKCYNYSVLFSLLSTAVPQTLPHPSLKLLLKTMLFNFWLEFPSLKEIYTISLKPSSFDFISQSCWASCLQQMEMQSLLKAASVMVPAGIISSHFMLNHIRFCLWPAPATL